MLDRILDRRFDGGNSLLAASILAAYFKDTLWEHVEARNAILKEKRDAVFAALEESGSDICTWSHPLGGLFIWVGFPPDVERVKLAELMAEKNILYAPGSAFHIRGEDVPFLRLAFGFIELEDIRDGILAMVECIRSARQEVAEEESVLASVA